MSRNFLKNDALSFFNKYGPIFRVLIPFGSNGFVFISDPAMVKTVWNDPASMRPIILKRSAAEYFGAESYFITDGEESNVMRKFFQKGFNFESLHNIFPGLHHSIQILLTKLDKFAETQEPAPLHVEISRFALDNNGILSFGYAFGTEQGDFDTCMKDIWAHITTRSLFPFAYWNYITTPEIRKYKLAIAKFRSSLQSMIDDKKKKGFEESDRDFLSMMLNAQSTGEFKFTDKQIMDQCFTFLNAGTDTLSSSLSSMIYLISINPEVEAKIIEELDSIIEDDRLPTWDDINKLRYCNNVIKEVLRVFSPVAGTSRLTSKDVKVGDYIIPKGYEVVLSIHAIHHSSKYYKNPEKFDPDRWNDDKESGEKTSMYSWLPFTVGPRNCQGNKYATVELKVILASLYKRYKFRLVPDQEIRLQDALILRLDSLVMFVEPRKK